MVFDKQRLVRHYAKRRRTFATRWPPRTLGMPLKFVAGTLLTVWLRAKDVVASMIKRMAHRNANVQLYTLEVSRWQ